MTGSPSESADLLQKATETEPTSIYGYEYERGPLNLEVQPEDTVEYCVLSCTLTGTTSQRMHATAKPPMEAAREFGINLW